MNALRRPTIPLVLFFGGLLLVGLAVAGDYGVTSDEDGLRRYGKLMLDFLTRGERGYETFSNLYLYGPVVPLLLELAERVSQGPAESIYLLRHRVNYLIYVLGVGAFFVLGSKQFRSWRWGLFGAAMLAATPRLFAHAFVNVKDLPFLSFFVVNVALLVTFLETRKLRYMAGLGVATALLIDVRILGVMMPALAAVALVADGLTAQRRQLVKNVLVPLLVYLAVSAPLTVLLWPYLWADPVARLVETFRIMNNFRMGPRYTRFMGEMVRTKLVPWYFLPVWLAISTPLPYLALFLAGLGDRLALLRHPVKLFQERSPDRFFLVHGLWLFAPLVWIGASRAIVYDDWRQVQFVYPAFVLFAVAGARLAATRLAAWRPLGIGGDRLVHVALAAVLASVVVTMVRLHPYQLVYFNSLVGGPSGAQNRFEMDYWGFSYKEAMQWLLSNNPGTIRVKACLGPGPDNAVLFADRARLRFVDTKEAEFMMCARWETLGPYVPGYPAVYRVTRDGAHLLYIRRIRHPDGSAVVPRR